MDAETTYTLIHDASFRAVTTGEPYALQRMGSSKECENVVAHGLTPSLVVASLRGAVAGLHQQGCTAADVLNVEISPTQSPDRFDTERLARAWAADALIIDEARPRALYDSIRDSLSLGWATDVRMATQLTLAIVRIASDAAQARC